MQLKQITLITLFCLHFVCFSQIDSNSTKKIKYFFEVGYIHQFNVSHFRVYSSDISNTSATTDRGGISKSVEIGFGLKINKWKLGIDVRGNNTKSITTQSNFFPYIILLTHDFDVNYNMFTGFLSLQREMHLNSNNYLNFKIAIGYGSSNGYNFVSQEKQVELEVHGDTKNYITTTDLPSFKGLQSDFSMYLFSKTKIGDFGIGVNFSILPYHYLTGKITFTDWIYDQGFSNRQITRGYLGFGLKYTWIQK
jgi:hypothetical protein